MDDLFVNSVSAMLRTLIIGVLAYAALLLFLRLTGKRTLSKMNAFDLVVTVALGSTLATVVLSKDVALAQGALGLFLLVGLQYAITWSIIRAPWVRRLVTGEPKLLVRDGQMLEQAMRHERVAAVEVLAAVRSAGLASLDQARAVILETDASFSVIAVGTEGESALRPVR